MATVAQLRLDDLGDSHLEDKGGTVAVATIRLEGHGDDERVSKMQKEGFKLIDGGEIYSSPLLTDL